MRLICQNHKGTVATLDYLQEQNFKKTGFRISVETFLDSTPQTKYSKFNATWKLIGQQKTK